VFFVSSDIEDKICILYVFENQSENVYRSVKLNYFLSFSILVLAEKGCKNTI